MLLKKRVKKHIHSIEFLDERHDDAGEIIIYMMRLKAIMHNKRNKHYPNIWRIIWRLPEFIALVWVMVKDLGETNIKEIK